MVSKSSQEPRFVLDEGYLMKIGFKTETLQSCLVSKDFISEEIISSENRTLTREFGNNLCGLQIMEKEIFEATKAEIQKMNLELEDEIESIVKLQIDKGKNEINAFFEQQELHVKRQTSKLASRCIFNMKKKILNKMIDHVTDLKFEAEKRLSKCDINKYEDIYKKILSSLILQGLYVLTESKVTVRVRERDLKIVSSILKRVRSIYKIKTRRALNLMLDTTMFISEAGVVLETATVTLTNTLKARLERILTANIPAIKVNLFGPTNCFKFRPAKLRI